MNPFFRTVDTVWKCPDGSSWGIYIIGCWKMSVLVRIEHVSFLDPYILGTFSVISKCLKKILRTLSNLHLTAEKSTS